jgi:transcriptional regulator with XRE-family HTH domain
MSEDRYIKSKVDPMDDHVGKRLKRKRILLGMSQQDLGDAVNVSIQQIQKYEKATNRISSGKLYNLAKLLQVPVSYFFSHSEELEAASDLKLADPEASEQGEYDASEREIVSLLRSYNEINDINLRKKILELVKTLAASHY